MKFYCAFFCVLSGLGLAASAVPAASTPASCVLEVEGKSYIDGQCSFELLSRDDGSFKIMGAVGDYFAYVYVEGENRATAHWNETAGVNRAHTPLGALTRDGACWVSDTARICATAVEEKAGLPPFGSWDCEVMGFTLDAQTYNASGQEFPVVQIDKLGDQGYYVVLPVNYGNGLFEIKENSLFWYSQASGDAFDCRRE